MSQQGYMVISDITGYTAYLSQSELEHAQDSLSSLLNLLIDHTEEPLVVSRLEGDAVISYSLKGSFIQGQTLVEIVERTYVDFRRALERMVLNTTCTCNACRNIPNLDLKFFVHYGEFMLQQLGGHVEMVGTDVNLVHRLAKNGITEQTGITAYVAYSRAAVDALGIEEICGAMTPHTETYEHIGEVEVLVQDMPPGVAKRSVQESDHGRPGGRPLRSLARFSHRPRVDVGLPDRAAVQGNIHGLPRCVGRRS
jgi:hypothetical protein